MESSTGFASMLPKSYHWMLVVVLLVSICQYTDADCSKVELTRTRWQTSSLGTYSKTGEICSGKRVYKQDEGENYMYFMVDGEWKGWMVGTTACRNWAGISVEDDADYPEDVVNMWGEVRFGDWHNSYLCVDCHTLSCGAIIGIVLGCLAFLILLFLLIFCLCKKKDDEEEEEKPREIKVLPMTMPPETRRNGSPPVTVNHW